MEWYAISIIGLVMYNLIFWLTDLKSGVKIKNYIVNLFIMLIPILNIIVLFLFSMFVIVESNLFEKHIRIVNKFLNKKL